ncbi:hypothetical protein [Chryseobacterium chendengshani]|uniref:hypothetical protein n=1 Tax=Chryseobacterium sp. LJ756 TaxID=2864113 RepID=UPI001C63DC0F|nr:hypothetical protein [Chryseobacterium sp. LJ756]MBW7675547.1 hypothetical protein [Chryseobacterium sp. LJ756]
MNFIKDFPNLFQFFGGYFPDSDLDNLTDEDIVSKYVLQHFLNNDYKKIEELIVDIERLINGIDSYWVEVGDEANRYFENSQDALRWLNMIKVELNKL